MIVFTTVIACALILAQGFAVLGFLRFVRSFGAYTDSHQKLTTALLYTHESNLAIHEQQRQMLDELRAAHLQKMGAA